MSVHVEDIRIQTQRRQILASIEHHLDGNIEWLADQGGTGVGPQCDREGTGRRTESQTTDKKMALFDEA